MGRLMEPPTTRWTRLTLTAGTLAAAGCLLIGLLLRLAGGDQRTGDPMDASSLAEAITGLRSWGWAMLGVLVLLATPAAGLVASLAELRGVQPRVAALSAAVLAVLAVAVLVALR
jgi:hypothetical protein